MLERTAVARGFGTTNHVDEGAQRGGDLPVSGIKQEERLQGGRKVLQDADQLARAQKRRGQMLEGIGDAKSVDRRTNRQVGNVDGYCARQRNPLGSAVPL